MKRRIESGNVNKENDVFTAGCCIICLSCRKWVVQYAQRVAFDAVVRRAAKNIGV